MHISLTQSLNSWSKLVEPTFEGRKMSKLGMSGFFNGSSTIVSIRQAMNFISPRDGWWGIPSVHWVFGNPWVFPKGAEEIFAVKTASRITTAFESILRLWSLALTIIYELLFLFLPFSQGYSFCGWALFRQWGHFYRLAPVLLILHCYFGRELKGLSPSILCIHIQN